MTKKTNDGERDVAGKTVSDLNPSLRYVYMLLQATLNSVRYPVWKNISRNGPVPRTDHKLVRDGCVTINNTSVSGFTHTEW